MILLAHTDSSNGTWWELAAKMLIGCAFDLFREIRYEKLAKISVGYLYNLRQREYFRRQV